jgi:hypothetical protein
MVLTPRAIAIVTAILVALCATDLSSQIIDMFGIQMPRLLFGMSWLVAVAFALMLFFLPFQNTQVRWRPSNSDIWFGVALVVWPALEWMNIGTVSGYLIRFVFACLSAWLVLLVTRMHLRVFGDRDLLVVAFAAVVTTLAVFHLAALVGTAAGVRPAFLRVEEIVDRNSVTLLLAAAFYLAASLMDESPSRWPILIALLALGLIHADLNHARAGQLLLMVAVILRIAQSMVALRLLSPMLILAAVAIVGLFAANPSSIFGISLGAGRADDMSSSSYRWQTNMSMLYLFRSDPLFGAGLSTVMYATASRYISHTLYLILPAAFGLVGVLPLIGWLRGWLLVDRRQRSTRLALLVFLLLMFSFFNDPMAWCAFAVAIVSAEPEFVRASTTVSAQPAIRAVAAREVLQQATGNWKVGVAVAAVCIGSGWLVLGIGVPHTARADVRIGRVGLNVTSSIESAGETARFIELTAMRQDNVLRQACRATPSQYEPIVTIVCKSDSPARAQTDVRKIVNLIMERHQPSFDAKRDALHAAMLKDSDRLLELDRLLYDLHVRAAADRLAYQATGIAVLTAERQLVRERIRRREQVWRRYEMTQLVASGIMVNARSPAILIASVLLGAAVFACAAMFAVALGAAMSKPWSESGRPALRS